jgi:hypothetical protein
MKNYWIKRDSSPLEYYKYGKVREERGCRYQDIVNREGEMVDIIYWGDSFEVPLEGQLVEKGRFN